MMTLSDEQIVEAVRGGKADWYRELVERYERRVYAVAWSQLGDAHLAEDAAQEAFIRGFRHVGLLNHGDKFGPWIASIARRTAINIGLRNRRELDRCNRWALDQGREETGVVGDESAEFCPPELLRQTLAELPDAHREGLVVFYLEGKSGAEAAAILGISETAFRVRLHRARGALRERLEQKLESALQNLRPTQSVVPSVMAVVLVLPSKAAAGGTIAAGVGMKISSVFSKAALFSFLPLWLAVTWLLGRQERKNYRDAEGFRVKLHRDLYRSMLWGFPVVMLICFPLFHRVLREWGVQTQYLILSCLFLFPLIASMRLLTINRSRFQIGVIVQTSIIFAAVTAVALNWISSGAVLWVALVTTLISTVWFKYRPIRMDYNLFLRASQKLLNLEMLDRAAAIPTEPLRRDALRAFGRFLGTRWLVWNFRWETHGLALRVPTVRTRFLTYATYLYSRVSRRASFISLGWNGSVLANCSERDAADLRQLKADAPGKAELEKLVAAGVAQAWEKFRAGDFAAAERALGQVPEADVFVDPPTRSFGTRMQQTILIGVSVFMLIFLFAQNRMTSGLRSSRISPQESPQQALNQAKIRLRQAKNETERFHALGDAAKISVVAGKLGDARGYAGELMELLPKYKDDWNYGNAIHDANLVLGRIAVREGEIAVARRCLIEAGKGPGSPQMNSFGPNMSLAKDLLEKGEKDVVLEYFELCRKFWKLRPDLLDQWSKQVKRGRIPDFGSNLWY